MRLSALSLASLSLLLSASPLWAQTPAAPMSEAPAAATAPAPSPAAIAEAAKAAPSPLNPKNSLNMNPAPNKDGLVIGQKADPTKISSLRTLIKPGTNAIYTGNEHGLDAFYVINGKQGQLVYITPERDAILIGMVFAADGSPTTFLQLDRLNRSGFDITPYLGSDSPMPSTTPAETSQSPERMAAQQAYLRLTGQVANTAPASSPSTPTATAPVTSTSPGEQLLQELNSASWFSFGNATAPTVTAFVDHRCSSCHEFFKILAPYALQNKIFLRLVPTVLVPSDAARKQEAVNLLSSDAPALTWAALVNENTPIPAPAQPNARALEAIDKNIELFKRWSLPGTPYVVYRSDSGIVRVMLDKPKDLEAFLTDLGVTP